LARRSGTIVCAATMSLLNKGDAVFHIATFEDSKAVEEQVDQFEDDLDNGYGARF